MRSLLAVVVCSALALPLACTTERRIIITRAPDAPTAPTEDEEEQPPLPSPPDRDAPEKSPVAADPLVLDLGEVRSGVDVSFDVPAGALGFNITIEGSVADFDQDSPYGIERITDPKGSVVHDAFTPKGGTHPTSVAAFDTIASASIPQGEQVSEDLQGKWTLRVGQYGVTSSKVKVKAKVRVQSSGDGAFHGGKLDLHLHVPDGLVVDGATLDGTTAESNAGMKERLDLFFDFTSSLLGIERGDVVWHAATSKYAKVDTLEKLLDGFAVSKGTKDGTQSLHVLFTNEISQNGEPFAAGISPGIPGAATIYGRGVSGLIVATLSVEQDVMTMLHEAGHFFGLNHTTEFDGQSADPLSDTPRCTTIADKNLRSCPDRKNVMFAAGAIEGPVALSAMQKRVYRGSPIYRAFTSGTPKTLSLDLDAPPPSTRELRWRFRTSNRALSPVESELSAGFCGLTRIDADAVVRRHGRAAALAQLRAAASDPDLSPILRGRANLALMQLGER